MVKLDDLIKGIRKIPIQDCAKILAASAIKLDALNKKTINKT